MIARSQANRYPNTARLQSEQETRHEHEQARQERRRRAVHQRSEDDPGIGQSPGLFATGEDPDLIEGENTSEGDVENDATTGGGAGETRIGPTNS